MNRAIVLLAAVSLFAMVAPTALASHEDTSGVRVCGSYHYQDEGGGDRAGVEANAFQQKVEFADPAEASAAAQALAADLADGDNETDEDGDAWDLGPDPFDGEGFVHVTVFHEGDEVTSAGTDDTDDDWSADC